MKLNNEPDEPIHIDPSFNNVLTQHRIGGCLDELGQALRNVTDAALLTGNPGVITLKLLIKPTNSGAIELYDDVKVTMPKAEKVGSLFFSTADGQLVRNNPNQLEMKLRTVEAGSSVSETQEPLREVAQ